jgi:molecular chaperone DnaJ
VVAPKTVVLKIPAGVDNGSRLRLTGEGEAGANNGPLGDLYVFIHVQPHELFERSNTDVICQLPISFVQAALGDKVKVPTLNGDKTIEIPKGTQPGDLVRLRGEGIPSLRENRRGDQIIQMVIKTPTNLNKKQEALLREFAKLEDGKFTSKLKNLLKSRSATAGEMGGPR